MEVQLRDEVGVLTFKETLKEAFEYADEHREVWKISFDAPSGERVRLVRSLVGWMYDPILPRS
jgi:hypothetical protein